MTISGDESRVAVLYREFGSVLCGIMQKRFGVPPEDSESLLHDIFTSLMRRGITPGDEEKWLIGAACNASRCYWRLQKEAEILPDDLQTVQTSESDIALAQILERIPGRARDILRMKYLEGMSGNEIAERYGTSLEYTHLLIHRSLEKARAVARENER